MAEYTIINVGANKRLNLYGSNVTASSIYNHQNITLWSKTSSNEQRWIIDNIGNGVFIKSKINSSFGLNAYRVGSDNWNCDVFRIAGNETDAAVNIIQVGGRHRIQLANYPEYYLTAESDANGANVFWKKGIDGTAYQTWHLYDTSTTTTPDDEVSTTKTLNMIPVLNQKYASNPSAVISGGCMLLSCFAAASYYKGGTEYQISEMDGYYDPNNCWCSWGNIPKAEFEFKYFSTQSEYLSYIRSEIMADRPVIIHMQSGLRNHYIIAYGFTNNAATYADIKVYDPYNPDIYSKYGLDMTLAQAFTHNSYSSIFNVLRTWPE